ncbi:hypothetical protein BJS_05855 [Bradyrhizobium japonicum SEMIA 5079]|nr:hypothetical protein BJS_05855 [Bradyrhizobium japonicum SEMIA 5079]
MPDVCFSPDSSGIAHIHQPLLEANEMNQNSRLAGAGPWFEVEAQKIDLGSTEIGAKKSACVFGLRPARTLGGRFSQKDALPATVRMVTMFARV